MKRRMLALFLAMVMVVGVVPVNAFAAETDETYSEPSVQEEPLSDAEIVEATEVPEGTQAEPTEAAEEIPEETEETTEATEEIPEESEEETTEAAEVPPEETEEVPVETTEETLPEVTEATVPEETTEETVAETVPETEEALFSSPIVTTLEELAAVSLDEYDSYLLAADLELPADWEPIDLYSSFDANGYTVTLNGQPLFGCIAENALVSNLILDGQVYGEYAGSLAITNSGAVRNCVSTVAVESTADWADNGGLVYGLEEGSISNCVFLGTLADDEDTDGYGMAANANAGEITNCYWLDAERAVWSDSCTVENGRRIHWEEAATASFLAELNEALTEDDLPWGVNEDGCPVPGGEGPGLEIEPVTLELAEEPDAPEKIEAYVSGNFDPHAKVLVTVEGHTLSHGFYIEPTIVSFDEFISYWADRGESVAPEDITAGGMIEYVIYDQGYSCNGGDAPTLSGPGYLGGVEGILAGKGDAVVPDCLVDDGITFDQIDGDDLYEFSYTGNGGWMFTEGNWLSDQSMASHRFSQFGTLYTVGGENYYVVRLQYTVAGLGADLGFVDFGTSYGYTAADKGELYINYVTLDHLTEDAKSEALDVMCRLDASQEEVNAANQALWDAGHAEKPEIIVDLDEEPVSYNIGEVAVPLWVEGVVSKGELSYAWYSSTNKAGWTEVGCTENSYTPPTDRSGTIYYKCIVTNYDTENGSSNSAESAVATVTCGAQTPVFTTDLSTGEVFYLTNDEPAALEVEAVVTDSGTVSYQWYASADGETWEEIVNATENSYTPNVANVGTTFYLCTATNTAADSTASADSAAAKVTVQVDTPVFEEDLWSTTDCIQLDETYELYVEASVQDDGQLSYQWYSGDDPQLENMAPIDGANGASYEVTDTGAPGGKYYRVKVTNTLGNETAETVSDWERVEVKIAGTSFDEWENGLDLPRDTVVYQLDQADAEPLRVKAVLVDWDLEGELKGNISYQWYSCDDQYKSNAEEIPGATGETFAPDLSASGYQYYYCEAINTVTNSKGESFSAVGYNGTSGVAEVRVVGSQIPVIVTDLPYSLTYTLDQTDAAPLTVEAEQVEDGGTLSYQWYRYEGSGWCGSIDLMTPIEGANQPTLSLDLAKGGTVKYACRVTNTLNGEATSTDSAICTVTVNCADPVIEENLTGETLTYAEKDSAETLDIVASSPDGGRLTYQWFCNSWEIAGATKNFYTPPTDEPGTFTYHVKVTNTKSGSSRSVDSASVTVEVIAIQQEITTEEQLRNMRPNGSYKLMNDIELTSQWKPIQNFTGILDGNGHTISKVSVPEGAGFFASTGSGAEIYDLGLNGRISRAGTGDIGGLVGVVNGETTISGCHVDIAVIGEKATNAGGIVGMVNNRCHIENSYYTGILRGPSNSWTTFTGGIVGQVNYTGKAVIHNSYTTYNVLVGGYPWMTGPDDYVNNYCAQGDAHSAQIPEDMDAFLEALGDAYSADLQNINRGYPILQWQFVPTDKTALDAAIAEAQTLNPEEYTTETWNQLDAALKAALEVSGESTPTQAAVDAACEVLKEAVSNLKKLPADKTGLEALVNEAEARKEADYTRESWAPFAEALKQARAVLDDPDAASEDVKQAEDVLKEAAANLVKRPADKAELKKAMERASALKEQTYTPASWAVFAQALTNARRVDGDEQASQADVDGALKALNDAMAALEEKADRPALSEAYKATADYLKKQTPGAGQTVGGEWSVIGLMRSRYQPGSSYQTSYYNKAVTYIKNTIDSNGRLDRSKSTDNARMVVALTSIGKDATDIGGHNLLTALTDMNYLKKQGLNGPIWALIAFDTKPYEIPGNAMTRETLVDYLLGNQLSDGGWNRTVGNTELDVDITGMALYALAPYYEGNSDVRKAVDKALDRLSKAQNGSGGFTYGTSETVESCVQNIVALSALGIDADEDPRFLKTGNSLMDAFLSYFTESGGFKHTPDGEVDQMATEQAMYAMAAYFRFKEGKNALFDMSDIKVEAGGDPDDGGEDNTETVDKTALQTAVNKAKSLRQSSYTAKSWAVLKAKLEAAETVLEDSDATKAEVDAAAKALNDAIAGLEKNTGSTGSQTGGTGSKNSSTSKKTTNKSSASIRSKLEAEVKKAEQLKKEDYTEESWKALETALKAAQEVLKNARSTEKQLTDAYGKLAAAEKALKAQSGTVEESRKKLENEIKESEKLVESRYTAKSWKVFADTLKSAKKVLESEKSTRKQLDDACEKLIEAKKGLRQAADSRTKLEELVKKCGALVEKSYTAESWASFAEALSHAKSVLADKNADGKQLDDALSALNEAGRALVPVAGDVAVETGGLSLPWLILIVVLLTTAVCGGIGCALWKRKK